MGPSKANLFLQYCREAFTSARNRYIGRESVMLRQKFLKDDAAWKNAVLDKALKEGLPAAIHALFHHPIIHEVKIIQLASRYRHNR